MECSCLLRTTYLHKLIVDALRLGFGCFLGDLNEQSLAAEHTEDPICSLVLGLLFLV
jgi:hypothetical protein